REATRLLADLPLEQREVVVARIWGGLTFEDVARLAGCSLPTAHRRYQAALAALRERLEGPWTSTPPPTKTTCATSSAAPLAGAGGRGAWTRTRCCSRRGRPPADAGGAGCCGRRCASSWPSRPPRWACGACRSAPSAGPWQAGFATAPRHPTRPRQLPLSFF